MGALPLETPLPLSSPPPSPRPQLADAFVSFCSLQPWTPDLTPRRLCCGDSDSSSACEATKGLETKVPYLGRER